VRAREVAIETPNPQSWLRRRFDAFVEHMEPRVFLPAAAIVVGFVALGSLQPEAVASGASALQSFITQRLGWLYVVTATGLLLWTLFVGLGPLGRIRLGKPGEEPHFATVSWFTMMLSAGMGIGIVFFGVAEPLEHTLIAPPGPLSSGNPSVDALRTTFFHWGFHPWAIYTAFALPLAWLHFRHDLPLAPRSLLHPWIGERIHGPIGHVVDVLATVGTLFGVATSLGLGAEQIDAGLTKVASIEGGLGTQILIIAVITATATVSVVSGIDQGIRRLSELTLGLFVALLVFVLVVGPRTFQVELFVSALGSYVQHLPETSLFLELGPEAGWQSDWTLFYWSWWISWSPFVGVFVARISRGRTVRELVIAAMLVPSMLGFLWFSVVGGAALEVHRATPGFAERALQRTSLSLFELLGELPLAGVSSVAALVLVVLFFITSSDSGSLVDDMVTSGGDPDPPKAQRVFWAVSEGSVAATLLVAGGLQAIRNVSLTTGLPVAVILLLGAAGFVRAARRREDVAP